MPRNIHLQKGTPSPLSLSSLPQAAQLTGLAPIQLRWLEHRLDATTDAQASRVLNTMLPPDESEVTKNRVRAWKRNPSFRALLDLCRTHNVEAFRVLAMGRMALGLRALDSLLQGDTPYERKEGLRALMDIMKATGPAEDQVGKLFEVLREPAAVRVVEVYRRPQALEAVRTMPEMLGLNSPVDYIEAEVQEME